MVMTFIKYFELKLYFFIHTTFEAFKAFFLRMSKKLNSFSDFKTDCDTKIALLVNSILFSILVSGKSEFFQLRPS